MKYLLLTLFLLFPSVINAQEFNIIFLEGDENNDVLNYGGSSFGFDFGTEKTIGGIVIKAHCDTTSGGIGCRSSSNTVGVKIGDADVPTCRSELKTPINWNIPENGEFAEIVIPMTATETGGCDYTDEENLRLVVNSYPNEQAWSGALVWRVGSDIGTATPYLAIYEGEYPNLNSTRIINVVEPETGYNTVTASTSVDFSINYISGDPTPDEICINLENLTTFQSLDSLCETITQNGYLNFSTSTTLISGNQYRWSVLIRDENNTLIATTQWYYFSVVSLPQSPYDPEESGNPYGPIPEGVSSTSTLADLTLECDTVTLNPLTWPNSICNLAVLLFVPSTASLAQLDLSLAKLNEKLPFSIFIEFKQGWDNANKIQEVEPMSLTLEFFGADSEVFSATTTEQFVGQTALDTFRFLVAASLWVAFGFLAFRKIGTLFNN